MARFNEILVGRINRFLQKLLGMKGSPPAPQLASEITPSFEIEDVTVEDRVLLQWNSFAWAQFGAANVGFATQLRLRNPVGSGVIAVIERVSVTSQAGSQTFNLSKAQVSTDLTTPVTTPPIIRDLRSASGQPTATLMGSAMTPSFANGVAVVGTVIDQIKIAANTSWQFIYTHHQELTLLPGDSYSLSGGANEAMQGSFWWRERALEESELRG
jgi:hypothetical protein